MSPITHLLISWSVANAQNMNRRERALITVAGIAPDMDGAGIIIDYFRGLDQPLIYWSRYHHVLCHNLGFGILLTLLAIAFATKRKMTGLLVFISFHLHLICDLLGSKGPDGYQWPIPYLLPFSDAWQWIWKNQWQLNAWPNIAVTLFTIILTLYFAWEKGISPLEMISLKANSAFVAALRTRLGNPGAPSKN